MTHRVPAWYDRPPDPEWADRVEREAVRQTDRRQARYEAAQRQLARAESKLARAVITKTTRKRELRLLEQEVDRRRAELADLHRELTQTPAGAQHRGKGAHRHVPRGGVI